MAITRSQTELGKAIPALDHNKPGYDRDVDSVHSDDLAPETIQYAEVEITSAELLALAATPITVVAAPGAGKVLEFVSATVILDKGATAYDDAAADGDLAIRFTDGSGVIVSTTLDADTFIDGATDQIRTLKPLTTDITPVADAVLVLDNTGAEFTGGDGVLRVKVAYRVHATGL